MYLTPIVYPASLVPDKWKWLYGLNPMVGVVEGFRWALLGRTSPDPVVMMESIVVLFAVIAVGLVYFRKMERQFADII
jgi:lipopolysaccharide transport system permease protein